MPLFEYACQGCANQFEAFVTSERPASCPSCHGEELRKLHSSPGMVTAGGGPRTAEPQPVPACRAQGGVCGCGMN